MPAFDASFDASGRRGDFPILSRPVHGKPLVYLDTAASAQKPKAVLDAMREMQETSYANVHRALHHLGNLATQAFEDARARVRAFINAREVEEIIFTSGATDAMNLVASSYAAPRIEAGDEILLSVLEHHSNIVPWHFLRQRQGAVLKWIPCTPDGQIDADACADLFTPRTKLLALTHMSNVLGTRAPIEKLIALAHERGVPVLLDGCQGIVHERVDVQALDCDFYAFSGHKLYGPTGIGVLYAKRALLDEMRPYRGGGEMIREVSQDDVSYGTPPHKFEAGTPPIVEAVGLAAAMDYIAQFDFDAITAHEHALADEAREELGRMNAIRLIGSDKEHTGAPVVSFVCDTAHPHDIAALIDRSGVAVRAGHHCAQPLMTHLGLTATARASFGLYNTREDVEKLAEAVRHSLTFFS